MTCSILHFITALFHEAKDKYDHHQDRKAQREMSASTEGGFYNHSNSNNDNNNRE